MIPHQLELHAPPENQLTLGEHLKLAGQAKAQDRDRDWFSRAEAFALSCTDEFTAETIREAVGDPESPGALGALLGKLSRKKQIVYVRHDVPARPQRHSNKISVWRVA